VARVELISFVHSQVAVRPKLTAVIRQRPLRGLGENNRSAIREIQVTDFIFLIFLLQQGLVFPKLGDPMPASAIRTMDSLEVRSGEKSLAYRFSFYGVRYFFAADTSSHVTFIYVDEPGYNLHDGIGIGDPAEKVMKLTGRKAIKEDGWAFYIPLFAGWNAAFVQGRSRTDGELYADTKVAFLFKRE
jgi:hypothetical protein